MSSRAYRLKRRESPSEGVRRIATGRTDRALERLTGAEQENLAVAVHGARKDLKKLRGLLRLVHHELGKQAFRAENRRYRDAGRLLSRSRDAEVKLETLAVLREHNADLPDADAERWSGLLESERDELAAAGRGEASGQIAAAMEVIDAGREKISGWRLRSDSWALVGPGLARGYRNGRRAMKRALAKPSTESIHAWRKRAKDLWYQLRLVEDAWPELLGTTVDLAHQLTEHLGDHHDLAVLAVDLDSRAEIGGHAGFAAAIARRQEGLLAAAEEIGRRLYAEKPKAFKRRIKGYWVIWRES